MVSTPTRFENSAPLRTLTPVRFLDSPKTKTTPGDSDIAACKARLENILKTIQDNFDKWQLAQIRGQTLCSSIEGIKTKALEKFNSNENFLEFTTCYPDELKIYCDKLAIIVSIFGDITKNARESLRQVKALSKLSGSCNEIFYRSWQLNEFIAFLIEISDRYHKESKVKMRVSEHLPHCTTRSDLIRCATDWEYPQYVDSYVKLMFKFLKEETNIKQ